MSKGLSRFQREQQDRITADAEAVRDAWVGFELASAGLLPDDPLAIAFRGHVSWVGLNNANGITEFADFNGITIQVSESE